jgi:O-antigen biosynthesis protein
MQRLFAMITTKPSREYTGIALESFFQTTPLYGDERVLLIDNDASFGVLSKGQEAALELWVNPKPQGFAGNVNQALRRARSAKADLFMLNNDLLFTPGWSEPLMREVNAILSPLSNREVQYEGGGFKWQNTLALNEVLSHRDHIPALIAAHRKQMHGLRSVLSLPFFCIKIPLAVMESVGDLDEGFGMGGGEDNDYCLRAIEAGFPVCYAQESFVLHFSGRSTWAGAESKQATEARVAHYRTYFEKKWGTRMRQIVLDEEMRLLETPECKALIEKGDLRGIVKLLKAGA